jgi:hypothetical protein
MKIAVFHHCVLSGARLPSPEHALCLFQSQMRALSQSGLAVAAVETHIGVNGPDGDVLLASCFTPGPLTVFHPHPHGESELATLADLQAWLKPGWVVLYFHMKGVSYPDNPVWERWRKCMEKVCVWNWEECVLALKNHHTVGAHWLTHEKYSMVPGVHRYWGGNFWWARSDYLLTLPPVTADSAAARYDAEVWIGSGGKKPVVLDFAPHWPLNCPA